MLGGLYRAARTDVLLALRDQKANIDETYAAYLVDGTQLVLRPALYARPAKPALKAFMTPKVDERYVPSTRQKREWLVNRMFKGAVDDVRVEDLPGLLEGLKKQGLNYSDLYDAKAYARAYLRAELKEHTDTDPLYKAVKAVEAKRPKHDHEFTQRISALPVWEALAVRDAMLTVRDSTKPSRELNEEGARLFLLMCCSSMGPKEMWVDGYQLVPDGLHIGGKKGERVHGNRDRIVPRLLAPEYYEKPRMTVKNFTERLKVARRMTGIAVTPYVARRCFAHWADVAVKNDGRVAYYMGHAVGGVGTGASAMTKWYAKVVKPYIEMDRIALIEYITQNREKPQPVSSPSPIVLEV